MFVSSYDNTIQVFLLISFSPSDLISVGFPDLDFLFHMFFLARYCKLLEENSFRGRTADFFYMLLFGATVLTGIVLIGGMIPYVSESFARIIFLSNSLTFMMVCFCNLECCDSVEPFFRFSLLNSVPLLGLCLEQAKPVYSHELPWPIYFHGCIPSLG